MSDQAMSDKSAYKVSEACRLLDLQPYVLRYWETEFAVLKGERGKAGQRSYSSGELEIIRRIKELLYDEGYTIAGAKKKLEAELASGGVKPAAASPPPRTTTAGSSPPAERQAVPIEELERAADEGMFDQSVDAAPAVEPVAVEAATVEAVTVDPVTVEPLTTVERVATVRYEREVEEPAESALPGVVERGASAAAGSRSLGPAAAAPRPARGARGGSRDRLRGELEEALIEARAILSHLAPRS